MTEQKQIEEMAMSIAECNGTSCDNCALKCKAYITCEILYDKDYRKVPEDSVVISREEYDEIKTYQSYIPEMKKAFDKIRIATIKETAEKILNEILFVESVEGWEENEQLVKFGNKIVDKIEELAKNME